MRILHVIDSLAASGGAEHGLVREITRFSDEVVDQSVLTLFPADQLAGALDQRGIHHRTLGHPASRAGWIWPVAAMELAGVVRRVRPDVIHSSLFTSNICAQLAGRMTATPVLSTFALSGDPALLKALQPGAGSRRAAALRRVAAVAARWERVWFRSLTQDSKATNAKLLGIDADRTLVIPRGVPDDFSSPGAASRSDLGLPEGMPLIVNVARQTAQKGQIHLLRAVRALSRDVPSHLVIVGRQGDATRAIHAEIDRLELAGLVTVLDHSDRIPDLLSHASVFAFPSLMEGLGTAILEAMASSTPVVAFDIPPLREVTEGGALASLVGVGDEAALAAALHTALTRPDENVLRKARAHVRSHHSVQEIARRLENRLREVAEVG